MFDKSDTRLASGPRRRRAESNMLLTASASISAAKREPSGLPMTSGCLMTSPPPRRCRHSAEQREAGAVIDRVLVQQPTPFNLKCVERNDVEIMMRDKVMRGSPVALSVSWPERVDAAIIDRISISEPDHHQPRGGAGGRRLTPSSRTRGIRPGYRLVPQPEGGSNRIPPDDSKKAPWACLPIQNTTMI